jgi:hypothetical protein
MRKIVITCLVFCLTLYAGNVKAGGFQSSYDKSDPRYYQAKEKYYLDRQHDRQEEQGDELRKKEQKLQQWQDELNARAQQQTPPAGTFIQETATVQEVIVTKKYYYWDDFLAGYVLASILCPSGWAPPTPWGWYPWTPAFAYPVYGNVWGGYHGGRIVVNNITTASTEVTSSAFRSHFQNRFGSQAVSNPRSEMSRHAAGQMPGGKASKPDSGFIGREHREGNRGEFHGHTNTNMPVVKNPPKVQHQYGANYPGNVAPVKHQPQPRGLKQNQAMARPQVVPQQKVVSPGHQQKVVAPVAKGSGKQR